MIIRIVSFVSALWIMHQETGVVTVLFLLIMYVGAELQNITNKEKRRQINQIYTLLKEIRKNQNMK